MRLKDNHVTVCIVNRTSPSKGPERGTRLTRGRDGNAGRREGVTALSNQHGEKKRV